MVDKVASMRKGGKALAQVRDHLSQFVCAGMSFEAIESQSQKLIADLGMKPSFSTVPGYSWATCIMKNHEVCHGIPRGKKVEPGDLITIDVGLICDGFHLDTTTSLQVEPHTSVIQTFLRVGKDALRKAISKARVGGTVYEVSSAMQKGIESNGYGVVYQLTGHGIGTKLHMDPFIPCYADPKDKRTRFVEDQTVAIEVMYTKGSPDLVEAADGWTFVTKDGSLSGMFEETVLLTKDGPEILTASVV